MNLVTAQEMSIIDETAINQYGIPGAVLMENAGISVVNVIKDFFSQDMRKKRILIFAGKGNNGGDGFVIARHLANMGYDVKVFLLCKTEELQGDAKTNWNIIKKMNIRHQLILGARDLHVVKIGLLYGDMIVDAIFGTGFKGEPQGIIAKVIQSINEAEKPVVAVDLPSGMEANTGLVKGFCIRATYTITFGLPKIGLVLAPAAGYIGQLIVKDISIPSTLIEKQEIKRFLLDEVWCKQKMPVRQLNSHKGTFGHVIVVGGSPGMTGAAILAASGAIRSGAGLVTTAVPSGIHHIIESKTTEVMSKPLPETTQGTLALTGLEKIKEICSQKVLVLGTGLSRNEETQELVRSLIDNLSFPAVIDADALYALAGCGDLIKKSTYPIVITPHPGEMAHLVGLTVEEVQSHRLQVAEKVAKEWNVIVVLKGAKTLVATPDGRLFINPTGNAGMATGGTGDVLAGMIGAFLAQGMRPEDAATCGVYLHGLAGDEVSRQKGQMGLTALDIVEILPLILKEFEG